jgi:hypothetical protein
VIGPRKGIRIGLKSQQITTNGSYKQTKHHVKDWRGISPK